MDPFYTLPFLVCLAWLMTKPRESTFRRNLARAGLLISTAYLAFTVVNKLRVNEVFERAFAKQEMNLIRYETRPTPLQNMLWAANAESAEAFYMGFHSFFDDNQNIEFQRFEKNQKLPPKVAKDPKIRKLKKLTKGWYNLEVLGHNRWALHDFRFGQLGGYQAEGGDFVFSYEIRLTRKGDVIVSERETTSAVAGQEILQSLWRRILGNRN
ncbi:MAG: hypothetical protein U5L96_09205 [Owenweeksia sp.]|nr:hypothetical protein [Owenweeksia sp.]